MLDDVNDSQTDTDAESTETPATPDKPKRRRAASRPAGAPSALFSGQDEEPAEVVSAPAADAPAAGANAAALFQAPDLTEAAPKRKRKPANQNNNESVDDSVTNDQADDQSDNDDAAGDESDESNGAPKRRRRRGGRRRRKPNGAANEDSNESEDAEEAADDDESDAASDESGNGSGSSRRRRRRRTTGAGNADGSHDDPPNTVTHVRNRKSDSVASVKGSTRLEAKKQRRREGREAGRRRTPILTEAEFLARRENVDRVMVVRQKDARTQIAVLEDGVLAEHYVNRSESVSMVGNVYLGRVQNVLPSMEAAFVDIGRGRNAVLYAGEVNWDAAGLSGQPKRIELALKTGDAVMVQVTKDPVGHKGARLTSQIALPGRYLVLVPGGSMTGISRRLPESERSRLKKLLRSVLPDDTGVIVRTAAEGASAEQIEHDVERLKAQWEAINNDAETGKAPQLLHGEPDLATRVVRDIFNEDFSKLIVSGPTATETIEQYVTKVAPDLADRVERWTSNEDVFAAHRVDEGLSKALDRKVWLPSGGSLVIDHTEAMTVIDVNTGKFTGQGGNLEETVTRNNLEAAEEIVRQLRLRDIGGIIVVDFIDMVLESNRDLVLRRLLECLGRDRTKHQVAEVTSLGLVQMTRKRIGQGLLDTFSEPCDCCNGRGVKVHLEPVDPPSGDGNGSRRRRPTGPIPGAPPAGAPVPGAPSAEPADNEDSAETSAESPQTPDPAADDSSMTDDAAERAAETAAGDPGDEVD